MFVSFADRACREAAAAIAAAIANAGDGLVVDPNNCFVRLAAAEAATAAAVQVVRHAATVPEAAVAIAAVLRAEIVAGGGDNGEWSPRSAGRSPAGRCDLSPSPVCHHRRSGYHDSPVIQTVYHDSGSGTSWPMLTKANYHEWSLLMKVKMQARELWDAIEGLSVAYHDDHWALKVIIVSVP